MVEPKFTRYHTCRFCGEEVRVDEDGPQMPEDLIAEIDAGAWEAARWLARAVVDCMSSLGQYFEWEDTVTYQSDAVAMIRSTVMEALGDPRADTS